MHCRRAKMKGLMNIIDVPWLLSVVPLFVAWFSVSVVFDGVSDPMINFRPLLSVFYTCTDEWACVYVYQWMCMVCMQFSCFFTVTIGHSDYEFLPRFHFFADWKKKSSNFPDDFFKFQNESFRKSFTIHSNRYQPQLINWFA